MTRYFSGELLYGDDFDERQVAAWWADEREAYASRPTRPAYGEYPYHAENQFLFYRDLAGRSFGRAVSYGGAYGEELLPIVDRLGEIVVVESSESFRHADLGGHPVRYVIKGAPGDASLEAGSADLVTCFGVLHHIPDVSATVRGIHRMLGSGGTALFKEPIVSMGDWRRPRGLTPHERGIPLKLFRAILERAGFSIRAERTYNCQLSRAFTRLTGSAWNASPAGLRVDRLLCAATAFNYRYHATSVLQKIRPAAVAYVVVK
jgi:SAM-dependent methyltransferase